VTLSDNQRGAAFMALAMATFAVEDALFKAATQQLPVGLCLLVFGICGATIFALLALSRRQSPLPAGGMTRGLLIRSAFELMGRLFFGLALAFADLSSTTAILQAAPLVVVAGAVVVFGERVGWRRWSAIALGLVGVLMVLRPDASGLQATAIFAVLGMIGFAGRDLATRAAPPAVTNAQLGVLGFVVLIVAGVLMQFVTGAAWALTDFGATLNLVLAAMLGVVAYSSLTTAMRTGEVAVVTPFRYTRLVFALIIAVMVFGEAPDPMMLAGAALIVASGIFALTRSNRRT